MHIALLAGLTVFSILAVLVRDLLKAAISLAAASIFLAVIFFTFNAPYIGVFEVSVVAGLITALFVSTIALTKDMGEVRESKTPLMIFPLFFIAFLVVDILVMKSLLGSLISIPGAAEQRTFGDVFWNQRTFDLVAQIGVIFAGVFSVLALFRKSGRKDE
jgi:NADH:ubiquinone oxidoreductase subunit 6 (subunit J)